MEMYRNAAMFAVGRAVFFGGFAITMIMLAFSFDFLLSLRAGAILTLILSALLLWFGQTAPRRRPERSETWILLAENDRPKSEAMRRVFHQAMQETYYFYSLRAFAIAMVLMAGYLVLAMFGVEGGLT